MRTGPSLGALVLGLASLLLGVSGHAKPYRYPLSASAGTVTAYFDHSGQDWNCGTKRYTGHKGSDFAAGKGTPIYAAAAGSVVYVNDGCPDSCTTGSCGCGGGFGNYVRLQDSSGTYTYYAHLQTYSITVSVGQNVTCGQHLGNMASSGNSTGNHLHFEVREGSTSRDPFHGGCSSSASLWVSQGSYLGRPGTSCATTPPPPDSGPPPPDSKPKVDTKPQPRDSGVKPRDSRPRDARRGGERPGPFPGQEAGASSDGVPPIVPGNPDPTIAGGCEIGPGRALAGPGWLLLLSLLAAIRRRGRP